ncbi:hypothetical protein KIW84_050800 [Lathyrus oleraceus]|uniref:Uncharacterized protein n=1 Tax=Pisum sativum TaxID=3888 RepID=A0A9D4WKA1_PEA|nr:hypothetical protein KIW84_050800 [Pisum sativum]
MNVARAIERELEEGRRDWTQRRSQGSLSRLVFGNKVVTQNEGRNGDWVMAHNNKDNCDRCSRGKLTGGQRGMSGFGQNKTQTSSSGNWHDRTVRSLSSQEIVDRCQKGLCFKCGGQHHPRHQCLDKNLWVIVLEDDSEDENEVRVLNGEDVETGTVGALPVLMLDDSGANKNFMSRCLALALGLRITGTPTRQIRSGDSYAAPTLGKCQGVIISVQWVNGR